MDLRKTLRIERDTLDELREAVADAANKAASMLSSVTSRQYAAQIIQDIASSLESDLTEIVVRARDASADVALDEVRIEAAVIGVDDDLEDEDDPEDEARATSVAGAFVAAWLLALLLAHRAGRSVKQASAMQDYRLRRIAATEVFQAYNAAALLMHQQIKAPEAWKRWVAILDRKTCAECRSHDGEEVPLHEEFSGSDEPGLIHPLCRCVVQIVARSADKAA